METSGVRGIKTTTIATEAHLIAINKVKPIVSLSFYIFVLILISLMLLLGFISPAFLVTVFGPRLASSTSTLYLLHLGELPIVLCYLLLIFLVRENTYATVRCIRIQTRIKT